MGIQPEKYYKKGQPAIDKTVSRTLKGSNEVVYGARSVNKQLPPYLRVHTEDWDIATVDDPESEAKRIEKSLDKHFGGNYFRVVPALHEGTFKIISNVTQKGIADVTRVEELPEHRKMNHVNYAILEYQLEKIKESLSNPENAFRHKKDIETKQRIMIAKRKHRRKKPKRANAKLRVVR